jgi:hypothetical protein
MVSTQAAEERFTYAVTHVTTEEVLQAAFSVGPLQGHMTRPSSRRVDEADWVQNAEDLQDNTRRELHFTEDHLDILQHHLNLTHNMNARLIDELEKECHTEVQQLELRANTSFQETSDMEKEQMKTKGGCTPSASRQASRHETKEAVLLHS